MELVIGEGGGVRSGACTGVGGGVRSGACYW